PMVRLLIPGSRKSNGGRSEKPATHCSAIFDVSPFGELLALPIVVAPRLPLGVAPETCAPVADPAIPMAPSLFKSASTMQYSFPTLGGGGTAAGTFASCAAALVLPGQDAIAAAVALAPVPARRNDIANRERRERMDGIIRVTVNPVEASDSHDPEPTVARRGALDTEA